MVLVCGGRDYNDREAIYRVLDSLYEVMGPLRLIHGGARGADRLAYEWTQSREIFEDHIEVEEYPADWEKWGKAAGVIRNQQMLDEGQPNLVLAFPGGKGTADMIKRAKKAGIQVIEFKS